MNGTVLIVEDERKIAEAIAYALKREGLVVDTLQRGDEALGFIEAHHPEVVILDVMLPGLDGLEILKRLPGQRPFGVIMLTAKDDIIDKVLGLELGADDYLTKPFDMRELLARVKALLRRIPSSDPVLPSAIIRLGEIELDPGNHTASIGKEPLELTPKEYDLLALLLSHPNRVYSREQLLQIVWGIDYFGGTRTVDIHIQRLRKKLGTSGERIQTVHGIGYKAIGGGREHQY